MSDSVSSAFARACGRAVALFTALLAVFAAWPIGLPPALNWAGLFLSFVVFAWGPQAWLCERFDAEDRRHSRGSAAFELGIALALRLRRPDPSP